MNPETQIERLARLGLLKEEDISELERPIATWKSAMARAKEGDPSQFALLLTHGHIPKPLTDDVYRLVIDAPWKELPKGSQKTNSPISLALVPASSSGRSRKTARSEPRAPSAKKRASVAPKGRQRRVKSNSR